MPPKKTQAELYKDISHGYYGTTENRGTQFEIELEEQEKLYEKKKQDEAMKDWVLKNQKAIEDYKNKHNIQLVDQAVIQDLIDMNYKIE